jgi:replicative DNA helicase
VNLFDKRERNALEQALISLVRDFDSQQDILTELINHGIDSPSYFRNSDYRKIFSIFLDMRKKGIIIIFDSFVQYVKKMYDTDFEKQKGILTPFAKCAADSKFFVNNLNFEFYIWRFKEHLLQDYWNHIFKMNETGKWKSNDLIERSFYIVEGFNELWTKVAKKFEKNTDEGLKNDLLERYQNNLDGVSTSCKTDLSDWDDFTGGFEKTELYIIGARPSMGKTTFALAMAKRMIARGKIVKIFSYEMSRKQLINRFISGDMGIPYQRVKKAQLSELELQQALALYEQYDNHPYLTVLQPKNKTVSEFNRLMIEHPGDCTIVDYLQLMHADTDKRKAGNREQEISIISGNLKDQAMQRNEAVIALSQLSRGVENRPGSKPSLSDLRESGAIEQDADVVIFVHRDAYYDILKGKMVPTYEIGNTDVIIAKGREIGTGNFKMYLDLTNTTLEEGWRYSNN